jgi:hypothetical protein
MKTKIFNVLKKIFAIIAILHGLVFALIIMAPDEDIVKVAEYRIYPPFIGVYVDRLYDVKSVYEKNPDDKVAKCDFEMAESKVVIIAFVNITVMGILFLIAYGIASGLAAPKKDD